MKWYHLFGNANWADTLVLQDQAERDRRARRLVDRAQDEQIEILSREIIELRVVVSAAMDLLSEKGLLSENEIRRKIQELTPSPAPLEPETPFANLATEQS